jgi:hypothetical protein
MANVTLAPTPAAHGVFAAASPASAGRELDAASRAGAEY